MCRGMMSLDVRGPLRTLDLVDLLALAEVRVVELLCDKQERGWGGQLRHTFVVGTARSEEVRAISCHKYERAAWPETS